MKSRMGLLVRSLLVLVTVFLAGCPPDIPSPVGQWVDSSLREAIVFNEDGTFATLYFYHPDPVTQLGQPVPQIPDDKTWKVRYRGTYTIDFTKNPAWIDLVTSGQGSPPRRSQGLITFLDKNTFYAAFEDVRPASIDNSSHKVRFTRAARNEISPVSK